MSKRALSVSILTAGLSAGLLAGAISPAAAQGNPVGGDGNVYFLSGALNPSGQAQQVFAFGDNGDEVYFGDWYGTGSDMAMVRRGNTFFVPKQNDPFATGAVFVYGDVGDTVLVGDWNGDGKDSLAIRRGNHFFVKNDNTTSGRADSEFYYGDAGDTVLVGNWNGVVSATPSAGVDHNGNNIFTDPAVPAAAPDLHPTGLAAVPDDPATTTVDESRPAIARDGGYDANGNGNYSDPGDRAPGTGVDNNGDGDFDDPGNPYIPADVAPGTGGKGDTIMIQRGNQFFVKNSITTGVADYTFYFGDRGDTILVGDWATPATPETATLSAQPAASGDNADQLAVRRGFTYYQSSELEAARADKKNPSTARVFAYGNADDTVFVASLESPEFDEFGRPVTADDPSTPNVDERFDTSITGDGLGVRR